MARYSVIVLEKITNNLFLPIQRKDHDEAEEALNDAQASVRANRRVIIRPMFNERKGNEVYFREWISNGGSFKEHVFDVGMFAFDPERVRDSANDLACLLMGKSVRKVSLKENNHEYQSYA